MFSRLCLAFGFAGVTAMCGGRRAACEPLKPSKPSPPELLDALHVDMFFHVDMFYMLFAAAPVSLPLPLCLFFSLGRSQRRFGGKKKKRTGADGEKRAIVGKCSFLSGMTQAAAVISTVIVGHHQRASITPARSWHRQQVPALPASLAPTRL